MGQLFLSSKEAKGSNYEEIVNKFKEAGFGNVEIEADYDVIVGWFDKEGEVETITVDGIKKFETGRYERVDVPIYIKYHDLKRNRE